MQPSQYPVLESITQSPSQGEETSSFRFSNDPFMSTAMIMTGGGGRKRKRQGRGATAAPLGVAERGGFEPPER